MSLKLIIGTKGAGKTDLLLSNRPADSCYVYHRSITIEGVSEPTKAVSNLSEVNHLDYKYLLVDHAHLYPDLLTVVHWVEVDDKIVVVAGAVNGKVRTGIGQVSSLVPYVEDISFLSARCECGMAATFFRRGEPACRRCFITKSEEPNDPTPEVRIACDIYLVKDGSGDKISYGLTIQTRTIQSKKSFPAYCTGAEGTLEDGLRHALKYIHNLIGMPKAITIYGSIELKDLAESFGARYSAPEHNEASLMAQRAAAMVFVPADNNLRFTRG